MGSVDMQIVWLYRYFQLNWVFYYNESNNKIVPCAALIYGKCADEVEQAL